MPSSLHFAASAICTENRSEGCPPISNWAEYHLTDNKIQNNNDISLDIANLSTLISDSLFRVVDFKRFSNKSQAILIKHLTRTLLRVGLGKVLVQFRKSMSRRQESLIKKQRILTDKLYFLRLLGPRLPFAAGLLKGRIAPSISRFEN